MNYRSFRNLALRRLEQTTDGSWTDFNSHDPGITILEQLAWAATDLSYRIGHSIPDLLAEGGADPYASLPLPETILGSHAVTVRDLRKVALDVEGVRQARIEPADSALPLFYSADRLEIGRLEIGHRAIEQSETPEGSEPLRLSGLHRLWIEPVDPEDLGLRGRVARRLLGHRNLCEDLVDIRVMQPEPIRVITTVEIEAHIDAARIHLAILQAISHHLSPPVIFSSQQDLLARGSTLDQILNGPRLDHGILDEGSLASIERPDTLHASDLIRVISDVDGVRAVHLLAMASDSLPRPWSLRFDPERFPRLDVEGSVVCLEASGTVIESDAAVVAEQYAAWASEQEAFHRTALERSARGVATLGPPPGRDRRVADFESTRQQFPAAYGIGEIGLPEDATAERRGRARQLQAYLCLFDQLLSLHAEQLAHLGTLLSFDRQDRSTYWGRPLSESQPDFEAVRVGSAEAHEEILLELVGEADSEERSQRFFDHLLARFAEQLPAAVDRSSFLRQIAELGSRRGTGFEYLEAESDTDTGSSGLEQRLRLILGLRAEAGEDLVLVEHLLLRPVDSDPAGVPLLADASYPDPYSLRLGFVLPADADRFQAAAARAAVERTLRAETPAHLAVHVHWLDADTWTRFRTAWSTWRGLWRERAHRQWLAAPVPIGLASAHADFAYRAARDHLIALLGLGETYPIRDIRPVLVTPTGDPWVRADQQASIRLELSQADAEYQVFARPLRAHDLHFGIVPVPVDTELRELAVPGAPPLRLLLPIPPPSGEVPEGFVPWLDPVVGNGGELHLPLPASTEDHLLLVRARERFEVGTEQQDFDTWLGSTLVLLLAPNPQQVLDLRLEMATVDTGERLQVSGGEPATFYHFHGSESGEPDGPEIALPAYFHRPEDGIGQVHSGRQLVVLGHSIDQPPVLELDSVPLVPTVTIRARRGLTGFAVALEQGAHFPPLPLIELEAEQVPAGKTTRIFVRESREGDRYQPFEDGESVKLQRYGNGEDLVFRTPEIVEDTLIEMRVSSSAETGQPLVRVFPVQVRVLPEP